MFVFFLGEELELLRGKSGRAQSSDWSTFPAQAEQSQQFCWGSWDQAPPPNTRLPKCKCPTRVVETTRKATVFKSFYFVAGDSGQCL